MRPLVVYKRGRGGKKKPNVSMHRPAMLLEFVSSFFPAASLLLPNPRAHGAARFVPASSSSLCNSFCLLLASLLPLLKSLLTSQNLVPAPHETHIYLLSSKEEHTCCPCLYRLDLARPARFSRQIIISVARRTHMHTRTHVPRQHLSVRRRRMIAGPFKRTLTYTHAHTHINMNAPLPHCLAHIKISTT